MFKEIWYSICYVVKSIVTSRLFVVGILFLCLMGALVARLFQLQIVEGETYQENYIQKTETGITLYGTRGTIYDRNGYPLAEDKLAYVVTFTDTGYYKDGYQKNVMLLDLIHLLNRNGETIVTNVPIVLNDQNMYEYTSISETRRLRFLRDVFGYSSIEKMQDSAKDPSGKTAEEVVGMLISRYGIGEYSKYDDREEETYEVSKADALQLINIRYDMAMNSYQKYIPITVSSNVSMETVTEVKENAASFKGVDIQEESIRVYNDSIPFAHITGYTGSVQEEQLKELQEKDPDYEEGDIVGQTGIESTMEDVLHASKGSQKMYVDSQGRILEVVEKTDPKAGNNVYLTLDRDLQVAVYRQIERTLAAILVDRIVEGDVVITPETKSANFRIPVKDAYFQLINNNVLSIAHFSSEDASEVEREIYRKMLSKRDEVLAVISDQLFTEAPSAYKSLTEEMQTYVDYVISMLGDKKILLTDNIEKEDDTYKQWREGTVSLQEYLYYALTNNWIDTGKLNMESKYSSTEQTFQALVDLIKEELTTDAEFSKKLFRFLIDDETLSGREICLALFDQDVLEYNEEDYAMLQTSKYDTAAYNFLKKKISSLELTPAQLALDPCSAGVTVTNAKTGEVLALVSYPSYDNNLISNSDYFSRLLNDKSEPFYNRVTKTTLAPGSTFKPITTIAGLEEGVLTPDELIQTMVIFTEQGLQLRCAAAPRNHGLINVTKALVVSCNYFFSEVGWRMCLDSNRVYNENLGIAAIEKYSAMFGLGDKTGVEIDESQPHISDSQPVPSAIGQGTHSYSNVQMNRYAAGLASRGNVYQYTIIDKTTDSQGNLLEDNQPEVISHIDISDTAWDTALNGMRQVIAESVTGRIFNDCPVTVAGKTGTAEQNKLRPNHAQFISFGPYEDPEIVVTATIINGYTAANAAEICKAVYDFYYDSVSMDEILNGGAAELSGVVVDD